MLDDLISDLTADTVTIYTEDRDEWSRRNRAQRAIRRAGRRRWWAPWTRYPHPTPPASKH